jgi:DNA-binding GntR family transcriptional regulator
MEAKDSESQASSLVNDAYDYLVEAITSFKIPTSAPISENKLASELGISRTPIRQALQRLEYEGLVTKSASSRFNVTLVTPIQVEETCDLLQIIDTYLFTKAAKNLDEKSAKELTAIAKEMIKAAENNDRDKWSEFDAKFHDLIMKAADNQTVAALVLVTRRKLQRFWTRCAIYENRLTSCSKEHEVLAQVIARKDIKAIEAAVAEHISHMRSSILRTLEAAAVF